MATTPRLDPDPRRRAALCLAATVAIVIVVYVPQLAAPLELQDDHRIIAPMITAHPGGVAGALRMWASAIRVDVDEAGRFRPVSQIFDVIGPIVLGPNALVWHAWLLLLAAVVAMLLYVFAFKVWGSSFGACVFALVAMLAPDPGPTASWYRLGPKESWEMILLAAGLAAMAFQGGRRDRRLEFLSFVLVVLGALSKEPFVLLLPALFGLRLWLEVRAGRSSLSGAFRRLRMVGAAYAMLFLAGIGAIVFVVRSAGSRSYGGRSLAISPSVALHALLRDLVRSPSLSIWFVPALLALWVAWRRRESSGLDFFAIILFVAWVGPQFALYATRGGMWDHYWIPCIVAFAAVNAGSIAFLAREEKPLYRLAMVVFALWLVNAVRIDVSAVRNFAVKAFVQQEAVEIAANHLTPQSILVIIADGDVESERAPSFADFVRARGGRYRRALLFDSRGAGGCRARDLRTGEVIDSIESSEVSVVVHLDHTEPPSGCDTLWDSGAMLRQESASGEYSFLSLRHLRLVTLPWSIRVDVEKQAPSAGVQGRA